MGMKIQTIRSLAPLLGERPMSLKELAAEEGVSVAAIRMRRRRLEIATGRYFPRVETRGRKPKAIAV